MRALADTSGRFSPFALARAAVAAAIALTLIPTLSRAQTMAPPTATAAPTTAAAAPAAASVAQPATQPAAPPAAAAATKPAAKARECTRLPLSDIQFGKEKTIEVARLRLDEYAATVGKQRGWKSWDKSLETTSCEDYLFVPLIGQEYKCLVTATFCKKT
jgi:hypothetical protein